MEDEKGWGVLACEPVSKYVEQVVPLRRLRSHGPGRVDVAQLDPLDKYHPRLQPWLPLPKRELLQGLWKGII